MSPGLVWRTRCGRALVPGLLVCAMAFTAPSAARADASGLDPAVRAAMVRVHFLMEHPPTADRPGLDPAVRAAMVRMHFLMEHPPEADG